MPGGHKCEIKQVEETTSKSGKAMLIVSIDTSPEDTQPLFYTNRYVADTRPDKKWSGNVYIVLEGEYGEQNLNRFLGAVDHSNENFNPMAGGELDPKVFKGMKVGVIFREEEYNNQNGEVRTAVKPAFWCNYNDAPEQKIPKIKFLPRSTTDPTNFTPSWQQTAGFVDVPADDEQGLPFK